MAPFSSHCVSLGFSLRPSVQVFVVVLFSFVLSMVPFVCFVCFFSVLFYAFFYPAFLLSGFVLLNISVGSVLLTVLFRA